MFRCQKQQCGKSEKQTYKTKPYWLEAKKIERRHNERKLPILINESARTRLVERGLLLSQIEQPQKMNTNVPHFE